MAVGCGRCPRSVSDGGRQRQRVTRGSNHDVGGPVVRTTGSMGNRFPDPARHRVWNTSRRSRRRRLPTMAAVAGTRMWILFPRRTGASQNAAHEGFVHHHHFGRLVVRHPATLDEAHTHGFEVPRGRGVVYASMRQVSRRRWGAFELDHPTDRREYGARGDDAGRPLQAAERFFEVGYLLRPGAIGGTGERNSSSPECSRD